MIEERRERRKGKEKKNEKKEKRKKKDIKQNTTKQIQEKEKHGDAEGLVSVVYIPNENLLTKNNFGG